MLVTLLLLINDTFSALTAKCSLDKGAYLKAISIDDQATSSFKSVICVPF